ncbi:hypothetical protein [Streptococcus hyointestinalis]|uniref:hypothetical protein n=1 Tax=Streptococcus hyointestinalis TaxID=1337 RepID=UPI0013E07B4E|nr:hypothetical protein [Streptococcus hyointestinalis]
MKRRRSYHLLEISIFSIGLIYLIFYILDDLGVLVLPSWLLATDFTSLSLFTFGIIILGKGEEL